MKSLSNGSKRPYKLFIDGERTRTYKTRENRFKAALNLFKSVSY